MTPPILVPSRLKGGLFYTEIECVGIERRGWVAFIFDALAPVLDELKRRGEIRWWGYLLEGAIVLQIGARPGASSSDLSGLLESNFRDLERTGKASWGQTPVVEWQPERRLGGETGMHIMRMYLRFLKRLIGDIQAVGCLESKRLESELVGILFLADTFGVAPAELRKRVGDWTEVFVGGFLKEGEESLYPQMKSQVRTLAGDGSEMRNLVRRLLSEGWKRGGSPELAEIFARHERSARRIGACLKANGKHFQQGYPWEFVVFHSYIHWFFCSITSVPMREVFAMCLIEDSLRESESSA